MAKLLQKPQKLKPSKSELAGRAYSKMKMVGMLQVTDAADFLQLHKVTLKEYIHKGLIHSIKVGSRDYLEEAELERLQGLLQQHGSLAKAWAKHEEEVKRLEEADIIRRTLYGDSHYD